MSVNLDAMTYGIELEWADVDRSIDIPPEWGVWDESDVTVMNSDGTAIDIKKRRSDKVVGGEINATPTSSTEELYQNIVNMYDLLKPTFFDPSAEKRVFTNHTHVHVTAPGLTEDVEAAKKLLVYANQVIEFANKTWSFLPPATDEQRADPEVYKAYKRYSAQHRAWCNRKLPDHFVEKALETDNLKDFNLAHFPISSKTGKHLLSFSTRPGLNVRSLWKHGTVEFRFFPTPERVEQYRDMIEFSQQLFIAGLTDQKPVEDIYGSREWDLPSFPPFDYELYVTYMETKTKV